MRANTAEQPSDGLSTPHPEIQPSILPRHRRGRVAVAVLLLFAGLAAVSWVGGEYRHNGEALQISYPAGDEVRSKSGK